MEPFGTWWRAPTSLVSGWPSTFCTRSLVSKYRSWALASHQRDWGHRSCNLSLHLAQPHPRFAMGALHRQWWCPVLSCLWLLQKQLTKYCRWLYLGADTCPRLLAVVRKSPLRMQHRWRFVSEELRHCVCEQLATWPGAVAWTSFRFGVSSLLSSLDERAQLFYSVVISHGCIIKSMSW